MYDTKSPFTSAIPLAVCASPKPTTRRRVTALECCFMVLGVLACALSIIAISVTAWIAAHPAGGPNTSVYFPHNQAPHGEPNPHIKFTKRQVVGTGTGVPAPSINSVAPVPPPATTEPAEATPVVAPTPTPTSVTEDTAPVTTDVPAAPEAEVEAGPQPEGAAPEADPGEGVPTTPTVDDTPALTPPATTPVPTEPAPAPAPAGNATTPTPPPPAATPEAAPAPPAATPAVPSAPVAPATQPRTVGEYGFYHCMTEAYMSRALTAKTFAADNVTLESCASFCSGYQYFGTEWSRECYCGNVFRNGSIVAPSRECNMPCSGDPSELCGGPVRLSAYSKRPAA